MDTVSTKCWYPTENLWRETELLRETVDYQSSVAS